MPVVWFPSERVSSYERRDIKNSESELVIKTRSGNNSIGFAGFYATAKTDYRKNGGHSDGTKRFESASVSFFVLRSYPCIARAVKRSMRIRVN